MNIDTDKTDPYRARPMRQGLIIGLGALLLSATTAHAAPAETETTTEVEVAKDDSVTVEVDRQDAIRADAVVLKLKEINPSELSVDEKRAQVESMLAAQREALAKVAELLADAREAKDMVQLNCVQSKLDQIKGLLKLSEQASSQMYDAIAVNDIGQVDHEFTKIYVASLRVDALSRGANECVGERSVFTGDTSVTVDIDGNIPTTLDGVDATNTPSVIPTEPTEPVTPPDSSSF